MLPLLFLASTAAAAPLFTDVATWSGFEALTGTNESTESCTFDSVNKQWVFFTFEDLTEVTLLTGEYPGTKTELEEGDAELVDSDTTSLNLTAPLYALGTVFVPGTMNYIYVASAFTASLARYNVDTQELTQGVVQIGSYIGVNGLCYDDVNNVLYATVTGFDFFVTQQPIVGAAGLYAVSGLDGNLTATRIPLTGVKDQNGELVNETYAPYIAVTGKDYIYQPNGCTVAAGKVWLIESRPVAEEGQVWPGALGIYDIAEDEFTINTEMLTESGDGMITIGNILVASTFTTQLLYYDVTDYPNGAFVQGYVGNFGADIDYDADSNIICLPDTNTGAIYFVQFSEPTPEPTTAPVTPDVIVSTAEPNDESGAGVFTLCMVYFALILSVLL